MDSGGWLNFELFGCMQKFCLCPVRKGVSSDYIFLAGK